MYRPTPYAFLDMDKVDRNIVQMAARLSAVGIAHRPHIKTHKSAAIARMQQEAGAKGITVAKLSEAEVMMKAGFKDILIAYPIVGSVNLQRFGSLHTQGKVRTTIDSLDVARGLSQVGEASAAPVEVLIELDGGTHRGGVQPGEALGRFAQQVSTLPGLRVVGVLSYFGQIYSASNHAQLKEMAQREASMLMTAKGQLERLGLQIDVLSGGSTASSFFPDQLRGITESRAGNYVFGDMNTVHLGLMKPEDCALRIRSTIISTPVPGYATIDAGTKTLTSDLSVSGNNYGQVIDKSDIQIVKLNEEHGYLRYDPAMHSLKVGDRLDIIPNHSCVIPNLYPSLPYVRGQADSGEIVINARGMNY